MINVEPFKAKLVGDPETRDTKRGGPVCNMRVRQIDTGRPSVFIDVSAFGEELAEKCEALAKGAVVIISGGLIYSQWKWTPKGRRKPQTYSKHSMIAESVVLAPAE
jgi:single-stranded DNA-binding protein